MIDRRFVVADSLSKAFGEQICDAAVRRTAGALQIISIRPSWCQDERNIERNLAPLIRDHSIGELAPIDPAYGRT